MAGVCHTDTVFFTAFVENQNVILIIQNEGRDTHRVSLPQKKIEHQAIDV